MKVKHYFKIKALGEIKVLIAITFEKSYKKHKNKYVINSNNAHKNF